MVDCCACFNQRRLVQQQQQHLVRSAISAMCGGILWQLSTETGLVARRALTLVTRPSIHRRAYVTGRANASVVGRSLALKGKR